MSVVAELTDTDQDDRPRASEALLVMDIQASILAGISDAEKLLAAISEAIAHARSRQMPVIFVVVGFRAGYPEISGRNKIFSTIRGRGAPIDDSEESLQLDPRVQQVDGDLLVVKRRVSAFTGSDLEVILRAKGIESMVLCGVASSGVVLSTLREAADRDYRLTVLSDCCADADPEVHRILLDRVFPRQATVVTARGWVQS
jgi:nicotinamidase-related amidase